ncbi:MAG: hypothetical protein SO044_04270 [Agathobaculum sp.]|uniref:hypothetical protein n=1 Tax=Agathobaculum sp. TaxID=2048138 RepID=UPI002A8078D2|nr:hypothetical protein [Agathobaculum sp.]MDY3711615.1 hypothetical protein [Agathobaculum sp.]
MKRLLCCLLAGTLLLAPTACGKSGDQAAAPAGDRTAETLSAAPGGSAGVDVDLTALSSTMVYSEVYNMMSAPDGYIGKSVKMRGEFAMYQAPGPDGAEGEGPMYFACIIADATACCSQGLEFVLAGEPAYPDGYPALGEEITVVGEFQTYPEDGFTYYHLVNATIE